MTERLIRAERLFRNQQANPPVEGIVPISHNTARRMMVDGTFPRPVQLGPRAIAWRASDIQKFIESLEEA